MVLISFTNIVVDDFNYASRNPFARLVFFLTHMHADHYQGLSNSWNYGPIYCSPITRRLLLHKYPRLKEVHALELDTRHVLSLSP
jgi:mRNA degradation ribonuclease J1/J2